MNRTPIPPRAVLAAAVLLAALAGPSPARAHCDTLDGPVVVTARSALEAGKLEPVLAWVRPADEAAIRDAFAAARRARSGPAEARGAAERGYLEAVVRLHRAGEGAPFTGLKPAGAEQDPAVAAVDRATRSGDPAEVEAVLVAAVRAGLAERFARLRAERPPAGDVAAGRRWVASYVPLVHWAEAVRAAAAAGGGDHGAHGEEGRGEGAHGAETHGATKAQHAAPHREGPPPAAGAHAH